MEFPVVARQVRPLDSRTGSAESIIAVAISPREVRLYFDKSLPDPKGLLEGSGSKVRSVTLKAASDLDHGAVKALIKAAITHSGVTFPRTGSTRMVIKSKSKKRKPKATVRARRTGTRRTRTSASRTPS